MDESREEDEDESREVDDAPAPAPDEEDAPEPEDMRAFVSTNSSLELDEADERELELVDAPDDVLA